MRIYRQHYFGFIYIWFDKAYHRFYLGSHKGKLDDGYICSSDAMKKAYLRRPKDFKRRILYWLEEDNRMVLQQKEREWLDLIPDDELGKKYYNKTKSTCGRPSPEELSRVGKAHWSDDEAKEKHRAGMRKSWNPERRAAHSKKIKARWKKGNYKERIVTPMGEEDRARQKQTVTEWNKANWQNPEWRKQATKNMSKPKSTTEKMRKPKSPEHIEAMRQAWVIRKMKATAV